MSAVRQIGIKMVVDAQSVTTEVPNAGRVIERFGSQVETASAKATRSLADVTMSVRSVVAGAAGLHVVSVGINAISEALMALPRNAFDYAKNLEVSQVGMAGILGSMTAINGQQTDYNRALQISGEYIRKLNDDALRTAASSQELTQVFQALLAPGLGAKMTLEEIRQLTVVGTNAVKSMGLSGAQVVQELRDLVAGGITAAGSTLATALGLKDSDIAKAKASSEGLFAFLMERLKGFEASSTAFGDTLQGKLDQVKEGATRVAADGMEPLARAAKTALDGVSKLFITIDDSKNVTLNQGLVSGLQEFSQGVADAAAKAQQWSAIAWEHRDAVLAVAAAYASIKVGNVVADLAAAAAAKIEAANASRLVAVQQAAETASNAQVVASSQAKIAAFLAELESNVARAQAEVAAQAAQIATLRTTQEVIVAARAEVVAKMDSTRATIAQAEAQLAAAQAAGVQSYALAMAREATQTLTVAQVRQAALMTELATLGKQQAGVTAAIATATAAQTAAQEAAAASATTLAAAQGAASVAGRALSGVLGFLGGPIGLVTTAVTLGVTAWTLWGNAGSSAEAKVADAVAKSTPDILADLDKQISKLNERNALAKAGLADLAKAGGEAAQRLGQLQTQIDNLKAGKGVDGGVPLPEPARVALLQTLMTQYGELYGKIQTVNQAQAQLDKGTGQLTLTVNGAEQAWRKSIDGIKTAASIQQDYNDKLKNSRTQFAEYEKTLRASPGFDSAKLKAAQAEQAQAEKSLADERDKAIKNLGAGAASARAHAIDAEIAATKHGYKLLAEQTAAGLAEVESQRKMGQISESDALQRRTELQLADIDAQTKMLNAELVLLAGRKDNAKKRADVEGQIAELAQKRINLEAQSARQQQELDATVADELERRIETQVRAAQAAVDNVRTAKLDQAEIGKTGAALGALRRARVEDTAAALERQAVTMDGIDLSGRAGAALRAQAQATRDLAKISGYNEAARMVSDYARSVQEASDATQFELSLTAMSSREREVALAQYRIAIDLKKKIAEIDALNPADSEAARKLKEQATATAAQAQAQAANQVYVRELTRSVDQYDDIFRKGFADMLNSGEGAWKSFTKSLGTTFKTTVADELYKTFAQPFVVRIVASLLGITGAGSSVANAAGSASSLLGAANNLSSLYSLGNNALGWLGIGGAAAAPGLGLSAATGAGIIGSGIGAGLGLGGASAAAGTGLGLTAGGGLGITAGSAGAGAIGAGLGTSAAAGGATAAGAGASSALAAIPGWGWAAMAAIAILGSGVFASRGANHMGGIYSTEGLSDAQAADRLTGHLGWKDPAQDFTRRGNAEASKTVKDGVDGLLAVYNDLAKIVKGAPQLDVIAGFASNPKYEDEGNYGYYQLINKATGEILKAVTNREMKGTPEEAFKQFMSNMGKDMFAQIGQVGPKWLKGELDKLGDAPSLEALQQALVTIGKINTAFQTWDQTITGFSSLSDDARSRMLETAGGIDNLAIAVGGFYDGFYSEAEKAAAKSQALQKQLSDLGVDIKIEPGQGDAAKAEYRKLVEDTMAGGNAELAYQLMSLSGLFIEVAGASQTAVNGVAAASQTLQNLAQERQKLEAEMLRAQGDEAGYVAAMRAIETRGYSDAELAAYDYNAALRASIDSTRAAADVARAAAQERYNLETQLLQLQGNTAALRERELAALDPTNQALQQQVWAQQEANEAAQALQAAQQAQAQAAQQAAQAAEQHAQAVAQEAATLQTRLLTLLGDTATLRARELDALDPSNRAIQQQIWAIEDAQAAQQKYTDALGKAQSAYDSAVSRVQSAQASVDSIRAQATSNYESANKELAAAQQRVVDIQRQAAQALRDIGNSILDWVHGATVDSSLDAEQLQRVSGAEYQRLIALAANGDQDALNKLSGAADKYIEATEAVKGGYDAARIRAQIVREMEAIGIGLANTAMPGGNQPSEMDAALAAVQSAQAAMIAARDVALAIGAPLQTQTDSLVTQYTKALQELGAATSAQAAQQAALDSIKSGVWDTSTKTGQVNTSVGTGTTATTNSLGNVYNATGLVKGSTDLVKSSVDSLAMILNAIKDQTWWLTGIFEQSQATATRMYSVMGYQSYQSAAFTSDGYVRVQSQNRGGSPMWFRKGGLVESPTLFTFGGGRLGGAGEDGTEALMPTQRMRNGDLGIRVQLPGMRMPQVVQSSDDGLLAAMGAMHAQNTELVNALKGLLSVSSNNLIEARVASKALRKMSQSGVLTYSEKEHPLHVQMVEAAQ